ncbi:Nucleoid-associated protein YejK [Fodinibius salinus]|uniref:Nucleoid-associated protein YejK n=1 Tax=Fodinibius salinus TaxID=860790 RepID=A0A5D3YFZ5_9BACT|nr:nucleoid-associated protein [Fodinibius salinus]TYP92038.1 Nucleoid-associated protein YejK [Fodinibius salinus]
MIQKEEIDIEQAIVHLIDKDLGVNDAQLTLSENLLPVDDYLIDLTFKLNKSYRSTYRTYATFKDGRQHSFPTEYSEIRAENTDEQFLDSTQNLVIDLADRLEQKGQSKGGYVVFVRYGYHGNSFLGVFLIRMTDGMVFERNDETESYIIDPREHLDLDKLAMACRVNNNKYDDELDNYLSFINKQTKISQYFTSWLAAGDRESNKTYTEDFLDLISLVDDEELPLKNDETRMTRDEYRKQIFQMASNTPERVVDLKTLGENFHSDEDFFVNKAEEHDLTIGTKFPYVSNIFNKLTSVTVKADGVELDFDRRNYGEGKLIEVVQQSDGENSKYVVVRSERLSEMITEEMDN